MEARGLDAPNPVAEPAKPMTYYTSDVHADGRSSSAEWSQAAVATVASATKKSGNHVCRPDVCHKGRMRTAPFHTTVGDLWRLQEEKQR